MALLHPVRRLRITYDKERTRSRPGSGARDLYAAIVKARSRRPQAAIVRIGRNSPLQRSPPQLRATEFRVLGTGRREAYERGSCCGRTKISPRQHPCGKEPHFVLHLALITAVLNSIGRTRP